LFVHSFVHSFIISFVHLLEKGEVIFACSI
jgi:hypothetical protein